MLFPSLSPLAVQGGASDHWEQSKRTIPPQPRCPWFPICEGNTAAFQCPPGCQVAQNTLGREANEGVCTPTRNICVEDASPQKMKPLCILGVWLFLQSPSLLWDGWAQGSWQETNNTVTQNNL